MQKPSAVTSDNADEVKNHPVNDVSSLEPLIVRNALEDFKKALITPVGSKIMVQCLKLALEHKAHSIIEHLSKCQLSKVDGDKAGNSNWATDSSGKDLFNLIYFQYVEYFSSSDKQDLRAQFLKKIRISKNRELLIAAITGDVSKFKATADFPDRASNKFHRFTYYATANDHVELVRYLDEQNQQINETLFTLLTSAIRQNAHQVFTYLLTKKFDPNLFLKLTIEYHRPDQFAQLVDKGAIITEDIFRTAISYGNTNIIQCCAQKINFPADSLTLAIKSGNQGLTRHLCRKSSDINAFDSAGFTPLCYAVIYNHLNIAKDLVSLGANIMAVNKVGTHAILIAADLNNLEILSYLLERLKSNTIPQKIHELLNTRTGTNILFDITNDIKKPWNLLCSPLSKEDNIKTAVIKLLIEHGASLFVNRPRDVLISFLAQNNNPYNPCKAFLCDLAIQQLYLTLELRNEHLSAIQQLEKFCQESSAIYSFTSELHELNRLRNHLSYFKDYTKRLDSILNKHLLSSLAAMIMTNVYNVPRILTTLIIDLINNYDEKSNKRLSRIVESLLALPNYPVKFEICLAIANGLYSKAIAPHNPLIMPFVIARYLYDVIPPLQNPEIEPKIKICTERIGRFSLAIELPAQSHTSTLTNRLIHYAIRFKNLKRLSDLLDYQCSQDITSWTMTDFVYFYKTIGPCSSFFSHLIRKISPRSFDMINLRLLLIQGCDSHVPKLLGFYLQALTGNTARRLLILSHILTYFAESIAQPVQIRKIFEKALLEMANIQLNDIDNFNIIARQYYKDILWSILKIRLELIKLSTPDFFDLELMINTMFIENDHVFLSQFQKISSHIAKAIDDTLTQHQLELSTTFLDQIELDCLRCLQEKIWSHDTFSLPFDIEADHINSEGKRLRTDDITDPMSNTTKRIC